MLKLDIYGLVWTIINLIVLFLLLKKFLFKPVLAIMEKRQAMIEKQLQDASEKENDANTLKQQYEDKLQSAKKEADDRIKAAKQQATDEYNKIIDNANKDASQVMQNASKTIEQERTKTLQDLQSEIAGLSMAAAEKIIGKAADAKLDDALMNQFLSEAGVNNDTDR